MSTIKAVVVEVYEEIRTKQNGSEFMRTACQVTDCSTYPELNGLTVFANRTIFTNGKKKSMVDIGEEVILHHSHKEYEGESYHFFEIQKIGTMVTESATLDAIFGV